MRLMACGLLALGVTGCTGPGGDNFLTAPDTTANLTAETMLDQTWISMAYSPIQAIRFDSIPDVEGRFDVDVNGFIPVRGTSEGSFSTFSTLDRQTGEPIEAIDTVVLEGMLGGYDFYFDDENYSNLKPRSYNVGSVPSDGFDGGFDTVTMFQLGQTSGNFNTARTSATQNTIPLMFRFVDLIEPTFNPFLNIEDDPNSFINPWLLEPAPINNGTEPQTEGVWINTFNDGGTLSFRIVPFTIEVADFYQIDMAWVDEGPVEDENGNILIRQRPTIEQYLQLCC